MSFVTYGKSTVVLDRDAVNAACSAAVERLEVKYSEKTAELLDETFVRFNWKRFRFETFKYDTVDDLARGTGLQYIAEAAVIWGIEEKLAHLHLILDAVRATIFLDVILSVTDFSLIKDHYVRPESL
jgi:hypothetical protein